MTPEVGRRRGDACRARSRCGPARSESKARCRRPAGIGGRCGRRARTSPIATISATITVFADEAAAVADAEQAPPSDPRPSAISRSSSGPTRSRRRLVREADVRSRRSACRRHVEPVTGGEAIVAAPAAGRFTADALPSVGDRVSAGQVLGRLEPRLDGAATIARRSTPDVAEAQSALEAARAEQARAERLLADRAVPARRVEDARRAVGVAEARLRPPQARLAQRDEVLRSGGGAASGNAFVLRAPIAGRVAEVLAALGASYDEGAPLFRIVRTDRVELQAQRPAERRGARADLSRPGARSARARRSDRR